MPKSYADLAWAIPEVDLQTRRRSGGVWALTGFNFQKAYAVLRLTELATCEGGLIGLRYEGAQDVDLMFFDGRQEHVQLKDRAAALDWAAAAEVLNGFLDDEISAAGGNARGVDLSYRLVTTSIPVGSEVDELVRRVFVKRNAKRLVSGRATAPRGMSRSDLTTKAEAVLSRVKVQVTPGSGEATQTLVKLATANLMRSGLHPAQAVRATSVLAEALTPRRTFMPGDVLALLRPFLPAGHPAAPGGPFRMAVPDRVIADSTLTQAFRRGAQSLWEAIGARLDIARDSYAPLRAALATPNRASVQLLLGPGGAGKSVLAQRLGWDLHASGQFIALELVDADAESEAWAKLRELAAACERRVLVIVDDVLAQPQALEAIGRLEPDDAITVLGTARPISDGQLATVVNAIALPVGDYRLTSISDDEVQRIVDSLEAPRPPASQLNSLQESGQLFLLAMVMINGSVEAFAAGLLGPLSEQGADDLYLDLCLCGQFDQSVPARMVYRLHPQAMTILKAPALSGLIFERGSKDRLLRSGHAVLAGAVMTVSGDDQVGRMLRLLDAVEPDQPQERRFGIKLVENGLAGPLGGALSGRSRDIEGVIQSFAKDADFLDVRRMARILNTLQRPQAVHAMELLATPDRIRSGPDAAIFLAEGISRKDFATAFEPLLAFYARESTAYGRRNFVARCAHDISDDQKRRMLAVMAEWLEAEGYPSAEAKSVLDVLGHWTGDGVAGFSGLVEEILRHARPAVDVVRAAILVVRRLANRQLFQSVLHYARPLLSVEALRRNDLLAWDIGRSAQELGEPPDREDLLKLLMEAAEGLPNPVTRGRLLKGALHAAPVNQLAKARRDALCLVPPGDADLLDAVINIRKGESYQ